jgi:hypothetical protein
MGSALGFDDIDRQISEKIHGTPIEAQFRLAIVQSYERVLHCASKSSSDGGWDNAYPFSARSWYGSPIRIWSRSSAARSGVGSPALVGIWWMARQTDGRLRTPSDWMFRRPCSVRGCQCAKPTRRKRSWKRGSERSGSNPALTPRYRRCMSCAAYPLSSDANACSRSPSAASRMASSPGDT